MKSKGLGRILQRIRQQQQIIQSFGANKIHEISQGFNSFQGSNFLQIVPRFQGRGTGVTQGGKEEDYESGEGVFLCHGGNEEILIANMEKGG